MPGGIGGGGGSTTPADPGRVIAHCQFTNDKDNKYEHVDIRVYKNSSLGSVGGGQIGGGTMRTAHIVVKDRIGQITEDSKYDYVYSRRVRKEDAGPYGEALTAAQMLGISQADSVMLYAIDVDQNRPVGLAVVHDVDDDPIDSFVLWNRQAVRCAVTDRD